MLTPSELARERRESLKRQAKRRAEEPPYRPNPYVRTRFGRMEGLNRKDPSYFDDMYVPPVDVTRGVM